MLGGILSFNKLTIMINWSKLFRFVLAALVLSVFVVSCQKDDPDDGEPVGRFTDFKSCTIIFPPEGSAIDPFYSKYINCSGIPVVSSYKVPDEALLIADSTFDFMLRGLDDVRNKMIEEGVYFVVSGFSEDWRTFPEWAASSVPVDAAAQYDPRQRAGVTLEESILCSSTRGFETDNITVHEFAHAMHFSGMNKVHSGFDSELRGLYNAARAAGLWDNTYAATNHGEYLADGMQAWYNVQTPSGVAGGNGSDNLVRRRTDLQAYDSGLYNFINKYFNDWERPPGCYWLPSNTSTTCPATVTDIDGNVYDVVNIAGRCWMKQNLKTTRYKDGTPIPQVQDGGLWGSYTSGIYGNFNDNPQQVDTFGRLYNWYAINNPAGLCPNGWRVANNEDWTQLGAVIADVYDLRVPNEWYNAPENGRDTYGFAWQPAGMVNVNGFGGLHGSSAFIVPDDPNLADGNIGAVRTFSNHNFYQRTHVPKTEGGSCRCVKD